jgi:hypothetical protein
MPNTSAGAVRGFSRLNSIAAALMTVLVFALILRRVPLEALATALRGADYRLFLLLMIPNTVFYFAWDTLVLAVVIGWFHGGLSYTDLLPARAASYVVGFFNTNAGRGTLAVYLSRRLRAPFLQLGGTVMFLLLTEYTQLVLWALLGIFGFQSDVTAGVLLAAALVAAFWIVFFAGRWLIGPRDWAVLRTFRLATAGRYAGIVLLRAPMFLVSLCLHYYATRAFGIEIPFSRMLTFLPVIFMTAGLPITVAHLGTTQAAWILFFGAYAPAPRLLAFSLAAHLVFVSTRAVLGVILLPTAYHEVVSAGFRPSSAAQIQCRS